MSQRSSLHLLNTLALEMKTALALAAQPALSLADKRMANIRYNRAVDRARKLGFFPRFVERPDGGVEVQYQPLQPPIPCEKEDTEVSQCPVCDLIHDEDNCPRCEERGEFCMHGDVPDHHQVRSPLDESFYRPHTINPFTRRGSRLALLDDKVEIVICEDGEALIEMHDAKNTRTRERLHNKEFRKEAS